MCVETIYNFNCADEKLQYHGWCTCYRFVSARVVQLKVDCPECAATTTQSPIASVKQTLHAAHKLGDPDLDDYMIVSRKGCCSEKGAFKKTRANVYALSEELKLPVIEGYRQHSSGQCHAVAMAEQIWSFKDKIAFLDKLSAPAYCTTEQSEFDLADWLMV